MRRQSRRVDERDDSYYWQQPKRRSALEVGVAAVILWCVYGFLLVVLASVFILKS